MWRVYASWARPNSSVKCVEWELQQCVIIVITKFRGACTPFIIPLWWLTSLHWVIWLMDVSGGRAVGSDVAQVKFFQTRILYLFFCVCAQWACAFLHKTVCHVMGQKQGNTQHLNHRPWTQMKQLSCESRVGVNSSFIFKTHAHMCWALEHACVWGP